MDLRPPSARQTNVYTCDLRDTWLGVAQREKENAPDSLHLQFDRIILNWSTRNATVLPGDQVVYQLGNQIVLLDINTRKLGLITLGFGPLVVLDAEPVTSQESTGTSPATTGAEDH